MQADAEQQVHDTRRQNGDQQDHPPALFLEQNQHQGQKNGCSDHERHELQRIIVSRRKGDDGNEVEIIEISLFFPVGAPVLPVLPDRLEQQGGAQQKEKDGNDDRKQVRRHFPIVFHPGIVLGIGVHDQPYRQREKDQRLLKRMVCEDRRLFVVHGTSPSPY